MNEQSMRAMVCEIGRRLYHRGLVSGNEGNISVKLSEDVILCTPTLTSKGFLHSDELCLVDRTGEQLAGDKRRTSEVLMHLSIYRHRPDVHAVVHTHPPHVLAYALTGTPIPDAVHPEKELMLGHVPLAGYVTPGTAAFAESIVPLLADRNAMVLVNHGAVTWGFDLESAWFRTEILEGYCRALLLARSCGSIRELSGEHMAELARLKSNFTSHSAEPPR